MYMEEKVSVMTEKKITLKTEFSVQREYFLTHWELFRYRHGKLRETCIWSDSARTHCREEISAQVRAERDTYPIAYSDLFFM